MSSEIIDRNIPTNLHQSYQPIEAEANIAFCQERYHDAINNFQQTGHFLVETQINIGQAIHKESISHTLVLSYSCIFCGE